MLEGWAFQVHRATHPRDASIDFARRLIHTLGVHPEEAPDS